MEKIAVIGTGCLLPGYVTKEQLWDRMIQGECFLVEETYKDKTIERGHLKKSESDIFFNKHLAKEQHEILNRKGEIYKWSTYVVQEALKESGYLNNQKALEKCGIVMGTLGMFVPEYVSMFDSLVKAKIETNINSLLDEAEYVFKNNRYDERISKDKCYVDTDNLQTIVDFFGFGKVTLSMSAACSTPLYAIKLACLYLEARKADMMVVGANCENESLSDVCGIFDLLGILTEKGHCNPLNENSEGLIISSGAGAVVLKRLDDAIRDKDHVLVVIDSIGWSNDGGAKSLLAPCMDGQIASYRDAYRDGIDNDIDYIECHSTGTAAGDIEEYRSIRSYFYEQGKHPLIGTLKGNTGHFLTASAMGAIVKVIMAMQHSVIPKTIRVDAPIGEEVVTENIPWPNKGRKKRAAVNAFGFGGINAHLVLSEYKSEGIRDVVQDNSDDETIVIVGMDLQIGRLQNKEQLFETLLDGKTAIEEQAGNRFGKENENPSILKTLEIVDFPKGAYIQEIPFDFMNFKIAAKNDMYYARRDLLLLNVANRALAEAYISVGSLGETAVIVNAGQDFGVLNFRASEELSDQIMESFATSTLGLTDIQKKEILDIIREDEHSVESSESIVGIIPSVRGTRISYHWHFKGPSFILTEQETALAHSIELAKMLLDKKIVKSVVIGTVELLGETEFLYAEKLNGNLDQIMKYGLGEGAAVLVLKTEKEAKKCKNRIYGKVEPEWINSEWHQQLLRKAAGYSVSLANYIELMMRVMESYYKCLLKNTIMTQGKREEILSRLKKNAAENDDRVSHENKRSFVKTIPTSLPNIVERKAYKQHIHTFHQEKKALDEKIENKVIEYENKKTFAANFENFLYQLLQEDERVNAFFKEQRGNDKKAIWNREQIVEMTNGSMAKILGSKYEEIDRHAVRSRMPSPPYLFVSRITKIDASYGELRPSSIEIEYDVDDDCIYLQGDKTIANVVYTEASQIGIFLGSYIGADFTKAGTLRFRVVDSKITFMSNKPVCLGDTLRLTYRIKNFVKRGETVIVFCSYEVYSGAIMLLKTDAIGGFFLEAELKANKGIIDPKFKCSRKVSETGCPVKKVRIKQYYDAKYMNYFFDGKLQACFDDDTMCNNPLLYINPQVRMIDAVTEVCNRGGRYGYGYIRGMKKIDASHWAFKAHFKNDPVLPGTLILNGANQLFMFWAMYYGFYNGDSDYKPQIVEGITVDIAFRGQVKPEPSTIFCEIHIKEVRGDKNVDSVIAEVNVYWKDINVIREDNVSLKFVQHEKIVRKMYG